MYIQLENPKITLLLPFAHNVLRSYERFALDKNVQYVYYDDDDVKVLPVLSYRIGSCSY